MHRRQYLPGGRDGMKLNRTRVHAENLRLKERLAQQDSLIAERNEQLQAWNREAIRRGWRAALAAIHSLLTTPIRISARQRPERSG